MITLLAQEENGGGLHFPPIGELLNWPDFFLGLNKVGLIYLTATLITVVLFTVAARHKALVPKGAQTVAEASVEFVRDSIVYQTIGPDGMRFMPFLLALFFFILFSNIFEVAAVHPVPRQRPHGHAGLPGHHGVVRLQRRRHRRRRGRGPTSRTSVIPPGVPKALLPLVARHRVRVDVHRAAVLAWPCGSSPTCSPATSCW